MVARKQRPYLEVCGGGDSGSYSTGGLLRPYLVSNLGGEGGGGIVNKPSLARCRDLVVSLA